MTGFFTKVKIPEPGFEVDYHSKLFFMGSCFSDYIGTRMQNSKFVVCHNPFGVIFNPVSIGNGTLQLLQKERFKEADLNFNNELWFSYSHSTKFSDTDKLKCLNKINVRFDEAKNAILKADVLLLTLGTSWVYELKGNGKVVANCHKIPSEKFNRYFSSVENTYEILYNAISELRKSNPSVKIIFTVSPIRHWKDGAIENQRSKAALILTIAKLQEDIEKVFYFPAYEIFMDELRDYRFYAQDMLHPSDSSIEYIWKCFIDTFLSDNAKDTLNQVQSILKRLSHKPFHKNTKAYQKFISSLRKDISDFHIQKTAIDFNDELNRLNNV
jgi:hypothetical protein